MSKKTVELSTSWIDARVTVITSPYSVPEWLDEQPTAVIIMADGYSVARNPVTVNDLDKLIKLLTTTKSKLFEDFVKYKKALADAKSQKKKKVVKL